jgi:hypothetical protein
VILRHLRAGRVAIVLLLAAISAFAQSTTETNLALNPTWTVLGSYTDATKTYTVQPGETVRYGTTYACPWLLSAGKADSAFAGQSTAYVYFTNKGARAVTFGKGSTPIDTFFGGNPAVWCDKTIWREDLPAFPAHVQGFVCPSACVTLLQNTDPRVALRLTAAGGNADYVETMTVAEAAAWFAAVQAYRAAWMQGLAGAQLNAVTAAMNAAGAKIAQAHGCRDTTSFQIVDPGFIVIRNGTPPFVGSNPPVAALPAGGALLSTTGAVTVGMFAR